jgi:hypothetical protein
MFSYEPFAILLSFWPSEQEMCESACENTYFGSLTEFYDSLNKLHDELLLNKIYVRHYNYFGMVKGRSVAAAFPPVFPEFLLERPGLLLMAALVPILYKLLELWVKLKNGRKIKLKVSDIEIEATQLSEEQFTKLVTLLADYIRKIESEPFENLENLRKETITSISSEGFSVMDSRNLRSGNTKERKKLVSLYFKSRYDPRE